ncbi:MAG: allantoinase [Gammaproteobacteria bacterium]|jgi:allantoinase
MLRSHGRYDYSPITERPDYSWPDGKRLAVYVANNVEVFGYRDGKGAGIAPPAQATGDSIYSWRDYGNRVGIWRLLEMLDKLNIPCESQLNTAIYDECPQIAAALRARGDEFVGHGVTNSEEQGGLDEAAEAAHIKHVTDTLTRHEGKAPVGWMSPWLSNSDVTPDLLQEAGYRYFMDWTSDDQPFWMKTRNGRILAMPYPIECNDNRALVWFRYSSEEFADMLLDSIEEMLVQSKQQPLVCPISLHPFVVGRPYRIRQLRRVFERLDELRDEIWLTQPKDICAHIESLPAGIVPGS